MVVSNNNLVRTVTFKSLNTVNLIRTEIVSSTGIPCTLMGSMVYAADVSARCFSSEYFGAGAWMTVPSVSV